MDTRRFNQGLARHACAYVTFVKDGPPETDWGDERAGEGIKRSILGPVGASLVRISPVTAIIFPLFQLSLKSREEDILMERDLHRLDLLSQMLPNTYSLNFGHFDTP